MKEKCLSNHTYSLAGFGARCYVVVLDKRKGIKVMVFLRAKLIMYKNSAMCIELESKEANTEIVQCKQKVFGLRVQGEKYVQVPSRVPSLGSCGSG